MQKSRVRKKSQLRKANKQTGTTAASTKTKTRSTEKKKKQQPIKKKKKKKKTQGIFLKDFLQVFVVFLSRKCM